MGLLAPLYALAALAIAGPVIFHLIRRQPRGQVEFSSLMFLQASPPRLTRRSRLDNLWLLLMRATVLGLIALAFARPFLRSAEFADAQPIGREILLLVDTSGSMQREDVWQDAVAQAKQYVDGLGDRDRVGLAAFDTELKLLVELPPEDEVADESGAVSRAAVRKELDMLKPGFRATKLAEQLIAAAELLQARATARDASDAADSEIVLVSDLHQSAGLDALQGYVWPENVRLDIRRVATERAGNARATLMQRPAIASDQSAAADGGAATVGDTNDAGQGNRANSGAIRVRVENNASSSETALSLRWLARGAGIEPSDATSTARTVNIQVPPGQARVIPVPPAAGDFDRLILSGDEAAFDNIVYVPRTSPRQERIGFVGQIPAKPEDDLFFFLSRVPLSTPLRQVSVERLRAEELVAAATDDNLAGLVIEWPIDRANIEALEEFARSGRPVIVVLSRPFAAVQQDRSGESREDESEAPASDSATLAALLGSDNSVQVAEAPADDFALLADIDFRHPLFQPLSDAKFNDFGKVRFWSHRVLQLSGSDEESDGVRVLARFDDRAPAVLQRRVGRGNLWILTAGWQATASQLALSSKFVPLLYGMLDPEGRALETNVVYEVGEAIDVVPGASLDVTSLDGSPVDAATLGDSITLEQPGLYWLSEDGKRRQIAVAMPLSESQLDPLDSDRFSQYGVITGKNGSAQEREAAARLSQVSELENRQKLWQWMLAAALGLLILETLLAARREKNTELGVA